MRLQVFFIQNKRKKSKQRLILIIILFWFLSPSIILSFRNSFNKIIIENNNNNSNKAKPSIFSPISSDISGNELYAEQIKFNIGGSHNLIQQSYCTNDTNALDGIDLSDPAFSEAAFYLTMSNGIIPEINPYPINNENPNYIPISKNYFKFYLYFEGGSTSKNITTQQVRILEILKNRLKIDFLLLNKTEDPNKGYLFEYYGLTPEWSNYFNLTLSNLPQDGYWKTLDYKRILSNSYLDTHYIQSSLLYLKKFDFLNNGINSMIYDQIRLSFDLSPLQSSNSLFNVASFQNTNSDSNNPSNTNSSEKSYINRTNNLIFFSVQYEGIENSKIQQKSHIYHFNLFEALNFSGSEISISSKCYNSPDGISLSKIDIGLIFGEVTNMEPDIFPFNKESFDQIENLLYMFNEDADFSFLDDYSFKVKWITKNSLTMLTTVPVNYKNSSDYVNFLELLMDFPELGSLLNISMDVSGGFGFGLSGSYIAPIQALSFDYIIDPVEPSLLIRKEIKSGSPTNVLNSDNSPAIDVVVNNPNNFSVWGKELNLTVIGITNNPTAKLTILGLDQNMFEIMGYNSDLIVNILESLGYTIEDLFHQDNPRFFMLDLNNTGNYNTLYPNLLDLNINRLFPYSPEFTQLLIDNADAFGRIALNPKIWNSSESIFNPENWKLDPGENFSISINNGLLNMSDKYSKIQGFSINTQPPHEPIIAIGQENIETSENNTFFAHDDLFWEISSEYYGNTYQIQQYLFFNNNSKILHITNKTISLDAIFLNLLAKSSVPNTNVQIEIYNHNSTGESGDGFQSILSRTINNEITQINLTLSNNNYNLSNYWDKNQNMDILFRITYENNEPFNLYLDFIQVEFQDRINQRIFHNQSQILYCSSYGNNQYFSKSNSITLMTSQSAIISISSQLSLIDDKTSLYLYNVSLENIGTIPAYNISVELLQMGRIPNLINHTLIHIANRTIFQSMAGNYTLKEGILSFSCKNLTSRQKIQNISLFFYLPNSIIFPSLNVSWNNEVQFNESNSQMNAISYQDFLSFPLDYNKSENYNPLYQLLIEYLNPEDSNYYEINQNVSIFIRISNLNSEPIFGLDLQFSKPFEGWQYLNQSDHIYINELSYNQSKTIELVYLKVNTRGYLLPSAFQIHCEENSLLQVISPPPLLLGNFEIELSKEISQDVLIMGDYIEITIKVKNSGTIPLSDIIVDDADSYFAGAFILYEGITLQEISFLDINQTFEFQYTLRSLHSKGVYNIRPAEISYFFGSLYNVYSNSISVKIQEPYLLRVAKIISPILIGGLTLFLTYKYKIHYSKEDFEYQRRESLLFGQSLRESSWHRKNLTEFFNEQLEKGENKNG
ncbi:hypothetical protein [Candidatus Harpocratesius sp.]